MTREIILLVGPAGGSTIQEGNSIKSSIERKSKWYGNRYRVRIEDTEGYEENRRRVNDDRSGLLIAFAHDGFGDAQHVRVVYTLEWSFLHILCRKQFLECENLGPDPKFGAVLEKLRYGQVYFGPQDSGTRQLAALVMAHYGKAKEIGRFQTHGITNWHDMRAAFNNGHIDLAFYSGKLRAPIVEDIARDKTTMLLDIGCDVDPIQQGYSHIRREALAANSYSNDKFCPGVRRTIASQRVLICSDAMSDQLAYLISHECAETFGGEAGWTRSEPKKEAQGELTYRLHPGAARVRRSEGAPWVWPNISTILGAVIVLIITECLQWLNKLNKKVDNESAAQVQRRSVTKTVKP